MIEVEKRGLLTARQKNTLLKFLNRNGEHIRSRNVLTIFIEFDSPFLGSVADTKASISIALIKDLHSNKVTAKLKGKLGKMESGARKEIEIPFQVEYTQQMFSFLEIFEIQTGCPRFYHREDYLYDGMEISIKDEGFAPDHFEIELKVVEHEQIVDAEEKIGEFLEKRDLKALSEQGYKEMMLKVFTENPPIALTKIDLGRVCNPD